MSQLLANVVSRLRAQRRTEEAGRVMAELPLNRAAVVTLPSGELHHELARQMMAAGREGEITSTGAGLVLRVTKKRSLPKSQRPLCGARTRAGGSCRAHVVEREAGVLAKRCRMHGGLSTGVRTEAGREAIRESNRRRAQLKREQEAAST